MDKLGLKQQTKRYFKASTMAMFACAIIATGHVIITNFHLVAGSVGTAGLFWGFVLVAAVFSVIYTSIAEMTSIVSLLADHRAAKSFSLMVDHSTQQLADSTHGMLPTDHLSTTPPLKHAPIGSACLLPRVASDTCPSRLDG